MQRTVAQAFNEWMRRYIETPEQFAREFPPAATFNDADRELFKACTSQCIWCLEQWPIKTTGGHMLHVGPFTQDKQLFSTVCKAESIRQAFEYVGYKGGKEKVWKARKPTILRQKINAYYADNKKNGGLGMVMDSPRNRSFWRSGIEATLTVAEWPKWMRRDEDTPPERLKDCRDKLRFFDELDYWTRKECTEGLQYRPHIPANGNMPIPTCNGSFGCTTCWGRYEVAYHKMSEKWCD